jgi:hypothetical protein
MYYNKEYMSSASPKVHRTIAGSTLFEVLVFTALFTVMSIASVTILVAMVKVHARQIAAAEVNSQAQFLIATIGRTVEEATVINQPIASGSVLGVCVGALPCAPENIVTISDSPQDSAIFFIEGAALPERITSDKVRVDSLVFTRHTNPNARDIVSVSFTISYNSPNPERHYTRTLQTSFQQLNP